MRLTFGDVKTAVATAIGMIDTDPRIYNYVNEAIERLINAGNGTFKGSKACYRVTTQGGMITWPRWIEAIEHFAIEHHVMPVRSQEFEFLDNGVGPINTDEKNYRPLLPDRGQVVTQFELPHYYCYVRCVADVAEAASQYLIVQGTKTGTNGEIVRTQVGTDWIDGERLLLSTTPQTGATYFSSITGIIKPTTNNYITLYAYDPSTTTQTTLARYAPNETRPQYRRSVVPECGNGVERTVTVLARHRWEPVYADNDFLLVENFGAIKEMAQAIWKGEENRYSEAEAYEARAIKMLLNEAEYSKGAARNVANMTLWRKRGQRSLVY